MAGGEASNSNNATPRARKREEDGSAYSRCKKCNKERRAVLMEFHDCEMEAAMERFLDEQMAEYERKFDAITAAKKEERSTEPKLKKGKKTKHPSMPKRPPSAFFLFMEDIRRSYKEANPHIKSVSVAAKEGEKWKSMTEEERKPYVDRAAEHRAEYGKASKSDNDADNADDEGGPSEE